MSSIVTLAEHGIGFCILCNKICVKLSGKHRNKNLTNKTTENSILPYPYGGGLKTPSRYSKTHVCSGKFDNYMAQKTFIANCIK